MPGGVKDLSAALDYPIRPHRTPWAASCCWTAVACGGKGSSSSGLSSHLRDGRASSGLSSQRRELRRRDELLTKRQYRGWEKVTRGLFRSVSGQRATPLSSHPGGPALSLAVVAIMATASLMVVAVPAPVMVAVSLALTLTVVLAVVLTVAVSASLSVATSTVVLVIAVTVAVAATSLASTKEANRRREQGVRRKRLQFYNQREGACVCAKE